MSNLATLVLEGRDRDMATTRTLQNELIQFLRKRDYRLIRELGRGGCGQTVLLHDDQLDESFVCKKYAPVDEGLRQELFVNFVREVKLLYKLHDPRVVRVFNCYLYPEVFAGYILMEFVDGEDIDTFVRKNPERVDNLFLQAIEGFSYLEKAGVLHRDIRPGNLMVTTDNQLKIIDLGFGKRIASSADFERSISLNWWCPPPTEFNNGRYDFSTEVYFVGKLFERLLRENQITEFKHLATLSRMCQQNPLERAQSFTLLDREVQTEQFDEVGFSDEEVDAYRNFADEIAKHITKVQTSATYITEFDKIEARLNEVYRSCMLETYVPDASRVINCFIPGSYYFTKNRMQTWPLKEFLSLLRSASVEQKRIIFGNLQTRMDAIPRYEIDVEDIPF